MTAQKNISTFEHDVNISLTDKCAILKMLKTILTNLSDPDKSQDPKYRQLRLGNAKIRSMTSHTPILSLLRSVGFQSVTDENNQQFLRIPHSTNTIGTATDALAQVTVACDRVAACQLQRQASTASSSTGSTSSTASTTSSATGLTEKQKARQLMEQAEQREREQARLARKRTSAQIKADKFVRENDPNWKPSVNAAAAKTGSSISTFRDKYGEQ